MYGKSADYYDALYGFKDYGAAVAHLQRVLDEVHPRRELYSTSRVARGFTSSVCSTAT